MTTNPIPHPTKFIDPCNTCTSIGCPDHCAYHPKPTHDEEDYERALNSSMSWVGAHRLVYGSSPPKNQYRRGEEA